MHIQADGAQRVGDLLGGSVFRESEFGIGMQVSSERHQRCDQILYFTDVGHRRKPRIE
jgi:hypothetical protein